ncbi:MAG: LCP family protein [Clostridia bacterium]|nr:LCP family protein [Clostridia bacterium]
MNRTYFKIFIVAFVGFLAMFGGVFFALNTLYSPSDAATVAIDSNVDPDKGTLPSDSKGVEVIDPENDDRTELEKITAESSRINVIAFGLNEYLADTMMFISFDPEIPQLDILSVPRDTYYYIEGHNYPGQKKMNAIYGMKDIGGVNGMKQYVSDFLGVPIDYYVRVDFKAVEAIVDTLGGYEVTVPFNMVYDDIYDTPPLHIDIKAGRQTLNGAESVKYLRFRQNNDGSIREGDIQRIPRQQHFVDYMMNKALSFKLPSVINTIISSRYVKTDLTLENALAYSLKAAVLKPENINFYTVPGNTDMIKGVSYWIHDPYELEKMLFSIYGFDLE